MSEWDNRLLCADGACIGVIGPDGTCKMCGRVSPGWGDERQRGLNPPDDDDDDDADDDVDASSASDAEVDDAGAAEADAGISADGVEPGSPGWDDRQLCADGACIGVIGSDGRCTVCGTTASATAALSRE